MFYAVIVLVQAEKPTVKTVTAEYHSVVDPKKTLEEAIIEAIEQAKIHALNEAFPTRIGQTNFTNLSSNNGSRFNSFAMSDVNGEWLETLSQEVKQSNDNGITVIHVKIQGKAREIVSNHIDLSISLMANGINPKVNRIRNGRFMAGDYFYVYFMSPVDGYLTIYLEDCSSDDNIQALVPYRGMSGGAMKIEANKPYIFFSREHADPEIKHLVGRLKVNSRSDLDFNRLYILFSPNGFVKALDAENDSPNSIIQDRFGNTIYRFPREIEPKSFQTWLLRSRLKDPDMQLITTIFGIEK